MLEAFEAPGAWPLAWLPDDLASPQGISILRLATAAYASRPTDDPPNTVWEARILGDVELSQSAMDALAFGGRVGLTVAEIDLWDGDGWAADLARYGTADGRAARLRSVPVLDPQASDLGTALADAPLVFAGSVRSVERAAGMRARLALGDIADRLDAPLQPHVYAGTGGLEGGEDLTGKPRPVAMGSLFNVQPVFLGNVDLGAGTLPTYQTHWRAIVAHDAVRIRGVAQTAVPGTPGVGQYRDWPALGMFQLGSSPDGEVTADLRGDAVGGYVNTTATILRRLLRVLGPQIADAEIDASAWALADYDLPGEIGWYRGAEPITAVAAVEEILAGCGAVLAGGRAGKIRLFDPLAVDAPQFELGHEWIIDCEPVALPATLRPTPREVQVEWGRNWRPLSSVAGAVPADERRRLEAQEAPVAIAASTAITSRVAQQRVLRLRGLYADATAAQARADKMRDWLAAGPRAVTVTTDRYLGQVELGHIGRVTYPAYGLEGGLTGTVMAWRESLGGRRLEITLVGV